MSDLNISSIVKRMQFSYVYQNIKLSGNIELSEKNYIKSIDVQVLVLLDTSEINIGSFNFNTNSNINIYNQQYSSLIDTVAIAIKQLKVQIGIDYPEIV